MGNYKSVNVIADSSKLTVMVNNTFGKLAKVDVTESYPEADS